MSKMAKRPTAQPADPIQPTLERVSLKSFRPATLNPNKGNANSVPMIVNSITMNGAGRPMLADKDGEMLAGSHSLQAFADAGFDEAIVIKSDGTKPIIFQRTDIDIDSAQGRSLQIGDNTIGVKSYNQDDELIAALLGNMAAEDAKLVQAAGFEDSDVRHLINQLSDPDNPYDEWVGMPEFEHDDLTGEAAFTIRVYLKDANDLAAFGRLLGKDLTGRKFVWFSKQPHGDLFEVRDEP